MSGWAKGYITRDMDRWQHAGHMLIKENMISHISAVAKRDFFLFVYLFVGNLSTFRFCPTDMFLIYLLNLGGQLNKIVLFLLEDNNKMILLFFFFLLLLSLLPSFSSSSLLDFQLPTSDLLSFFDSPLLPKPMTLLISIYKCKFCRSFRKERPI